MNKQQFSGKTLDDALNQAARAFDTDVASLSYTVIPQSGKGLLAKIFSRSVQLEAWIDSNINLQEAARAAVREAISGKAEDAALSDSRKNEGIKLKDSKSESQESRSNNIQQRKTINAAPQTQKAFKSSDRTPKPLPTGERVREKTRPSLREPREPKDINSAREPRLPLGPVLNFQSDGVMALLEDYTARFLIGVGCEPISEISPMNDSGDVHVSAGDPIMEEHLSKSDRLAMAYEHVFKRLAQKKLGDVSGRLLINAGSAHETREERLKEMALSMAEKVKKTGKTVTLASRSSQERRIIHMALDGFVGVATRSIGSNDSRKLVIYSTEKPSSPRNEEPRNSNRPPNPNQRTLGPNSHKKLRPQQTRPSERHNQAQTTVGSVSLGFQEVAGADDAALHALQGARAQFSPPPSASSPPRRKRPTGRNDGHKQPQTRTEQPRTGITLRDNGSATSDSEKPQRRTSTDEQDA